MERIVLWLVALVGAVAGIVALLQGGGGAPPAEPVAKANPIDQALITRAVQVFRDEARPVLKDIEERLRAIERIQQKIGENVRVAEALVTDANRYSSSAGGGSATLDKEALAPLRSSIDELRARTEAALKPLDGLEARLKALEARPVHVVRDGAGGPTEPTGPQLPTLPVESGPTATPEEIERAMADLQSDQLATLFGAIETLRGNRVVAAVPRLAEILKSHKDNFARSAAAAALGTIRSPDGIKALIEGIIDDDSLVGQQAFRSFREVTGYAEELDPTAGKRERRRARDSAASWWKTHEIEVRERLSQEAGS